MKLHKSQRTTARRLFQPLEPLEVRALFSALIAVTGNTHGITSGDITPSVTDYTDFGYMSTTASALIGKLTHSFSVANSGSGTLILTGGTKPIIIGGANAKDFSVITLPSTTIAAGTTNATTFVIAFTPKGTGVRKATITIPSNDTGTPAFTFVVQGTGIATTNFTNGLQIGVTTIGTGTDKAIPGSQLTINYTEYLTNGTSIASSLDPGGTPFQFNLGIGQAIPGWDQGLIGLKKNEGRVLFVPAALAFGSSGSGSVPPNAPLVYTIADVDLVQPLVAISGNNVNIVFNDSTPSLTDGTLIGTTVPGSNATSSTTFKLVNAGQGSIFYPTENIVITGKNAADFTTTLLDADSSGTFASFTVTYHPGANAGTSNAVVNIITNDPLHPDFKFNVSGVATPFQDLTTAIATANYAAPIITGATTQYKLPVKVTNHGNLAVPGTPITLDVYLHDVNSSSNTLIYTTTTSSMKNLALGKTSTVNLSFPIPISIPTGNFEFFVKVNDNHTLTETDYADNAALSPQSLGMTQGFYDLTVTIGSTSIPAATAVITGSTAKYNVPFTITNSGNLPIPSNAAPITYNLYAHNATSGVDTLIMSASTTALRNLAVGKSAKVNFSTTLPITLPTATYDFRVKVNENSALTESSLLNNVPISAPAFDATQGFIDLFASMGTATTLSAISGGSTVEKVQVFVFNNGNITIPASTAPVSVDIYLHNSTTGTDTLVSSTTTTALRNLAVGKSATLNLTTTVPIAIATADYQLIVKVNDNNAITESNHANDSGSTFGSFGVIQGVYNITGNLSTSTFTATPTAALPFSGKVTFALQNTGNLTLPANQKVVVQLEVVSDSDNSLTPVGTPGTLTLSSWAAGKSTTFPLSKTITSLTAGSYHLAVLITVPGLTQSTADDLLEETAGLGVFELTVS